MKPTTRYEAAIIKNDHLLFARFVIPFLFISLLMAGCTGANLWDSDKSALTADASTVEISSRTACPVTEPEWIKPPEDSAVQNEPEFGNYLISQDRSIWASAWWVGQDEFPLRATQEGNKVGWYRPAGAPLEIAARRVDGEASAFKADVPCCYPTRFQATGLYFSTAGCWEVTAKAAESELSFIVWVDP
jgi:hypothetical protein